MLTYRGNPVKIYLWHTFIPNKSFMIVIPPNSRKRKDEQTVLKWKDFTGLGCFSFFQTVLSHSRHSVSPLEVGNNCTEKKKIQNRLE